MVNVWAKRKGGTEARRTISAGDKAEKKKVGKGITGGRRAWIRNHDGRQVRDGASENSEGREEKGEEDGRKLGGIPSNDMEMKIEVWLRPPERPKRERRGGNVMENKRKNIKETENT